MNKVMQKIYPADQAPPRSPDVFYHECIKKHDGKIPPAQRSEREFTCDLFLQDVKIRKKVNECIAETPLKEKVRNLFF